MGNEQRLQAINEVYLTQIQQRSTQDLMYQSKLSKTNYDTKLAKKIYKFGSASDYVASYIQKLKFFGQYIECDNLMLPVYCYIREQKNVCSDEKELQVVQALYRSITKSIVLTSKMKLQHGRDSSKNFHKLKYFIQDKGMVSVVCFGECLSKILTVQNEIRQFENQSYTSQQQRSCQSQKSVDLARLNRISTSQFLQQKQNELGRQEIANIRQNTSKLHPNICQTFSIAIVLIEICTFMEGDFFYDLQRMKINQVNLGRALEMIQKLKYSKLLVNLLKIMLSGQNDRPLPSQIYQTFKPYQHQINTLQPFKFDTHRIYQSLHNSKASYY